MTNSIRIANTLTQQATISTNLHTCVAVCVCCVCDGLGIGCGRTCETCMQSDSCCPYAAAGWQAGRQTDKKGAKANKLDKCILCIQGTPVTPTHLHTHTLAQLPHLVLFFYNTLLCACGWVSYKNSCTFCLYASRMLLLPPV